MSEDDRSIPASERRLLRARERGMMPVRRAPIALAGVLGAALGMAASGGVQSLATMLQRALGEGLAPTAIVDAPGQVRALVVHVLVASWPALLGGVLGAVLGTVAQTNGVLSWHRPRGSVGARLLAMSGPSGWGRATAALGWAIAAFSSAGVAIWMQWPQVARLPHLPLDRAVGSGLRVTLIAACAAFGALAGLAVVDALWARARWLRSLAMTPQDVREEQRSTDGDPLARDRRRRAARQALRAMTARSAPELPAPSGDLA